MTHYHYHHHDNETPGINDDLKSNPGVLDDGELLIQQAASASGDGMVRQNNLISFSSFLPLFYKLFFPSFPLFLLLLISTISPGQRLARGRPQRGENRACRLLGKAGDSSFLSLDVSHNVFVANFHNSQIFAVWVPVCEDLFS